jgi:hypothetical protein
MLQKGHLRCLILPGICQRHHSKELLGKYFLTNFFLRWKRLGASSRSSFSRWRPRQSRTDCSKSRHRLPKTTWYLPETSTHEGLERWSATDFSLTPKCLGASPRHSDFVPCGALLNAAKSRLGLPETAWHLPDTKP